MILTGIEDPQLAELLQAGKVGVIPTDTVYGLVCMAANEAAVKCLYACKQRDNKPGTVVAANIDQLVDLGLKARYLKPVAHYWPNSISVIIPNYELGYIHLGKGGIAVRIPKQQKFQDLLKKTGPLLTTSANLPGKPEAKTISEAEDYFGSIIDFYADGGDLSNQQASTVIRVVDDIVEVVREGAVVINEKGEVEV